MADQEKQLKMANSTGPGPAWAQYWQSTDPNTKPVRHDFPGDIIRLGKPPRPKPNDLNPPVANIHMAPNNLSLPSSEMSTRTIMSDQGLQSTT